MSDQEELAFAKQCEPQPKWNTHQTMQALRERYKAPEYAFMEQVGDRTGSANRFCDALAMSCWTSFSLERQ